MSDIDPYERNKIKFIICKKSLGTRFALFNHMERAHGSLQYNCNYCAYSSSSSRKNLKEHLHKRHQKFLYKCKNCDFQSNSLKHISVHENTNHRIAIHVLDSIKDVKVSKVKDVDKKDVKDVKFSKVNDDDKKDVKAVKVLKLKGDDKKDVKDVKVSKVKDDDKKDVKDVKVSKVKDDDKNDVQDVKISKVKYDDKREKQYCCWRCKATFITLNILKKHQNRDHKHLKCSLCDKYFSCQANLRIHMGKHTGQRPFPCPTCDKAYLCHTNRKKHIENTHSNKNKIQLEPITKSYPCPGCSKVWCRHECPCYPCRFK